jgi:tRNA (adenine57-N1/adenine58-N1)-methyltransferase
MFDASRFDQFNNLKRAAQIMDPKDLGFILSNTMVDKNSIVFDSGSGTGASACFFAAYTKKVYTFDIRQDHIDTVEVNAKRLDLKNVKTSLKNVYEDDLGVKEKCDLFVLDVPEPEMAISNIDKNLKIGGFIASYSPCITQTNNFINNLSDNFMVIKNVEVIERHWHAEGRKVRPKTKEFSHSGFISIVRKIQDD